MDHLSHHGVTCPEPMRRDDGGLVGQLNGKPAIVVSRLPGAPDPSPDEEVCRAGGRILASLHVAAVEYDASLDNPRGASWRKSFAQRIAPKIPRSHAELIDRENDYQAACDDSVLPQGIIHGDYFHDNVLWDDEGAGGVIDFYFACDDVLLFDVAIAVNDWCVRPDATLDHDRAHAFIAGYSEFRPLEANERELWPAMLRRAALRTWLGRLGYNFFPRDSHMTIPKDHEFSRRLLEHHVAHARALAETLD